MKRLSLMIRLFRLGERLLPWRIRRRCELKLALRLHRRLLEESRPTERRPQWKATLLVKLDEESGLISPLVQISGYPVSRGRVVVELTGESGGALLRAEKTLSAEAPSTNVQLEPVPVPAGTRAEDLAGREWHVRLEKENGRKLARWSKRLVSSGAINCEAELALPRPL
jgi:hypothetical protein